MKLLAKLLVCALALAAVTDAADTVRRECGDGSIATPLPTTAAPVTDKPGQTTPAPSTGKPDQTTPTPTVTTPTVTTVTPTTTTPAPTTTTAAPPAATTPVPTTAKPTKFDKNQEYTREGIDCAGFLRLPRLRIDISKQDCVLDYKVKFATADEPPISGCVVCEPKWGKFVFDNSMPLASQDVPLCGGLPLCTRFKDYGMLTELDLMCVLSQNGTAPIEDPKVCGFNDN